MSADKQRVTKPAAQLLREVAERDPEAHNQALARAYGVHRDPKHYRIAVAAADTEQHASSEENDRG